MKVKILADFQICIGAPLIKDLFTFSIIWISIIPKYEILLVKTKYFFFPVNHFSMLQVASEIKLLCTFLKSIIYSRIEGFKHVLWLTNKSCASRKRFIAWLHRATLENICFIQQKTACNLKKIKLWYQMQHFLNCFCCVAWREKINSNFYFHTSLWCLKMKI